METSYCPKNCHYNIDLCRLVSRSEQTSFLQIQNPLYIPIKQQKISLRKVKQFKQFTNRISKPETNKHSEEMTLAETYRQTQNIFLQQNIKNRQRKQMFLLKNKKNGPIPITKTMKSTEFTFSDSVNQNEYISARVCPKISLRQNFSLRVRNKQFGTNSTIKKSLTQRQLISNIMLAKNMTDRNQSDVLCQSSKILLSAKYNSPQKFIPHLTITQSIPIIKSNGRFQRDFQKEYETVNSVFSDSVIDQRVSQSSVEIDFFHPSRGKMFDRIEEIEIQNQN